MTQSSALPLFAAGRRVAEIIADAPGALRLEYDRAWLRTPGAFPLSLNLPLRAEPHEGESVAVWVEGQLPYGALRLAVEAATGLATPLALLARLGGDLPGAATVSAPEPHQGGGREPGYRPLETLETLLALWSASPLALGETGASHAICEQEERLPVALLEAEGPRPALALFGAPSTHLLWREPPDQRGALENRAFFQSLGGAIGLPVAGFETFRAGGARLMLVERDDRERKGGGWIRRHRESLAQAMGVRPQARYGREPGDRATLEQVFLWADGALPARERLRLLDAFMFNALIGATDAHALRYAIRLQPNPALAPLTELAGPGFGRAAAERRFAQRVGGPARWPERLEAEHWRAFAHGAQLNPTFTLDRLSELAEAILERTEQVAARLSGDATLEPAILGRLARETASRAQGALLRLGRRPPATPTNLSA